MGDAVAIGGHGGVDVVVAGRRAALGERRNVNALAFAGERLVEAGGEAGESSLVQCWLWRERKLVWSEQAAGDAAMAVAAAGKWVFAGGVDRRIAVHDVEDGRRHVHLEGHSQAVLALAASPDGSRLASGGADGVLRVWSVDRLELVRAIHSHTLAINALAWSPDGRHLASGSSDRTIRVWQPEIGRLVRIVRGHHDRVLSLAYGDKHIWSGAADGKLRVIDSGSDAILSAREGHRDWVVGVALTRSGVVSADWTGRVLRWEGEKPVELDG